MVVLLQPSMQCWKILSLLPDSVYKCRLLYETLKHLNELKFKIYVHFLHAISFYSVSVVCITFMKWKYFEENDSSKAFLYTIIINCIYAHIALVLCSCNTHKHQNKIHSVCFCNNKYSNKKIISMNEKTQEQKSMKPYENCYLNLLKFLTP